MKTLLIWLAGEWCVSRCRWWTHRYAEGAIGDDARPILACASEDGCWDVVGEEVSRLALHLKALRHNVPQLAVDGVMALGEGGDG